MTPNRCWDILLKPKLDAVASRRQAKASEPQIMLKWLHAPSGASSLGREAAEIPLRRTGSWGYLPLALPVARVRRSLDEVHGVEM